MKFQMKTMFCSLLIISLSFASVECDCKVVINEVNVFDPQKPGNKEFIELKSTCDEDIALRSYKLIGFNCQSVSGTIDMIVTPWNHLLKNGFFTIGGTEVSKADLKIPSDYIKLKSDFDTGKKVQQTITNFLMGKNVRAIGLLHDERKNNPFDKFKLSKKQPSIKIDDEILEQLKEYLEDLVVYGESNSCSKCEIFEKIKNEFSQKYILRDFTMKTDITLNRCTVQSSGFLPERFKLGKPTPGEMNDCTGPRFILEDQIVVSATSCYVDDYDNLDCASCSNQNECTASIRQINMDDTSTIEQAIDAANRTSNDDICTPLMMHPDGSNTALTVVQENSRKRHIGLEEDYSQEQDWQTVKFFR